MGVNFGIINHTKKQYIEFDRRFHDWSVAVGEWLAIHWYGDHLEIASDTGGKLQDVAEGGPWGEDRWTRVSLIEIQQWDDAKWFKSVEESPVRTEEEGHE